MHRTAGALLGLLLAVAVTGCHDGPPASPGRPASHGAQAGVGTVGVAATTTPGAQLRAGLTYLLVERVHLLWAVRTAPVDGREAAGEALDAAAAQLADEVVPDLLRADLLTGLASEARGVATSDLSVVAAGRGTVVGAVSQAVPSLSVGPLEVALAAAVDPLARGVAPGAATDAAAERAADLLANAVAARASLGSTETSAAEMRAHLTALLTARAYAQVEAARAPGRSRDGVAADDAAPVDGAALADAGRRAAAAVEAADAALADALSDGERTSSLELAGALRAWSAAVAQAAAAARTGDAGLGVRARAALDTARAQFTSRLAEAVPALPARLVAPELARQQPRLLAAIGAAAGGEPGAVGAARAAAAGAPVVAALLAGGLADARHLS